MLQCKSPLAQAAAIGCSGLGTEDRDAETSPQKQSLSSEHIGAVASGQHGFLTTSPQLLVLQVSQGGGSEGSGGIRSAQ